MMERSKISGLKLDFAYLYLFGDIQIEQRCFIGRQVEIWLLRLKNLSINNQPVCDEISAWIFVLIQVWAFQMFLKVFCMRLPV